MNEETIRGMENVTSLPATEKMTTLQALISALDYERMEGLEEVLIIGFDKDRELFVRSSGMTRRDALWLTEIMRIHALGGPK